MPDHNPFAPPTVDTNLIVEPAPQAIPDEIRKKIKGAWIAALVSAAFTLVFAVFAIQGFGMLNLLDVGLILGLAFGIYKRSRTCAVIMLAYFIVSKVVIIVETGKVNGLLTGLVFLYFYWQGVVGTFRYHRLLNQ